MAASGGPAAPPACLEAAACPPLPALRPPPPRVHFLRPQHCSPSRLVHFQRPGRCRARRPARRGHWAGAFCGPGCAPGGAPSLWGHSPTQPGHQPRMSLHCRVAGARRNMRSCLVRRALLLGSLRREVIAVPRTSWTGLLPLPFPNLALPPLRPVPPSLDPPPAPSPTPAGSSPMFAGRRHRRHLPRRPLGVHPLAALRGPALPPLPGGQRHGRGSAGRHHRPAVPAGKGGGLDAHGGCALGLLAPRRAVPALTTGWEGPRSGHLVRCPPNNPPCTSSLQALREVLPPLLARLRPQLVLYNAGAERGLALWPGGAGICL